MADDNKDQLDEARQRQATSSKRADEALSEMERLGTLSAESRRADDERRGADDNRRAADDLRRVADDDRRKADDDRRSK